MSDVCLPLLRLVVCIACSSAAVYPSRLSSGPGSSVPRPAAVSVPAGDDLVSSVTSVSRDDGAVPPPALSPTRAPDHPTSALSKLIAAIVKI